MKRHIAAAFAVALIFVCAAALFGACDAFVFGISVATLPDNVKQLILTSDGKAPVNWNGEKLLFDSGAVVDGTLVLEPGYGLGDMTVSVYGKPLELKKESITGHYTFSFTMQHNGELTFEGAPALAPRAVYISGVGADGVFLEANGEEYELTDGNVSLQLETSATEPFTLKIYSTDYMSMPSCDAVVSPASVLVEPYFSDGRGGAVCTVPAGIGTLHVTLALGDAKGTPHVDLVGNPDDMFYAASVNGFPLVDGKFPLSAFENGEAKLTLTLTDEGQEVWDAMCADGVPLGLTVNGIPVAASASADGGNTVFTAPLKPAYEYFSDEVFNLFLFEVTTAIPETAARQNGFVRIPSDAAPDIIWEGHRGVAFVCDEQPSLIFDDAKETYYAPNGYVCFDAWVPVGKRDTVPSYSFTVYLGNSLYAQEIEIYDVDEEAEFASDTSPIKALLTSEWANSADIGNSVDLTFAYLYKVSISPELLAANEKIKLVFVYYAK